MSKVIHVRSEDEWRSYLQEGRSFGGKGVVVDFFAEWCVPCKVVSPEFEKLSSQYTNITFLKVDVDELPDVAHSCAVKGMPTFQAYFKGEKIDEVVGANVEKLTALVTSLSEKVSSMGQGMKLGGASAAASGNPSSDTDTPEARRARMAAAAEARFKAMGA